jgi:hypothetical protein
MLTPSAKTRAGNYTKRDGANGVYKRRIYAIFKQIQWYFRSKTTEPITIQRD